MCGVILSSSAWAAEGVKIGVMNMRELEKSKKYQALAEKMQKEFAPREKELNALMKSYKDKSDKFQKDSSVLSEAEKGKQERELVATQRELQRLQNEFREDGAARQQEEMQKFMAKVRDVMQQLGKEERYDLIMYNDALTYATPTFDISSKVIAKLDQAR